MRLPTDTRPLRLADEPRRDQVCRDRLGRRAGLRGPRLPRRDELSGLRCSIEAPLAIGLDDDQLRWVRVLDLDVSSCGATRQ